MRSRRRWSCRTNAKRSSSQYWEKNMANWALTTTTAHKNIGIALEVVDGVLSYMKDTQGKPSAKERSLFAAAVVFTYGIWENYVEQLAIELVEKVATTISPDKVPERIRKLFDKSTAWELTVSPGWRTIWVQKVRQQAIGDDDENYGLNTAKSGQVRNILELAGVQDAFEGLPPAIVPEHLAGQVAEPTDAINRLVELRGEIVHTGTVPDELRKKHVRAWRQFIEDISGAMDNTCRQQCKKLLP